MVKKGVALFLLPVVGLALSLVALIAANWQACLAVIALTLIAWVVVFIMFGKQGWNKSKEVFNSASASYQASPSQGASKPPVSAATLRQQEAARNAGVDPYAPFNPMFYDMGSSQDDTHHTNTHSPAHHGHDSGTSHSYDSGHHDSSSSSSYDSGSSSSDGGGGGGSD